MSIKDSLYNYFVRKNGRVWYEYERYVREHMEEHRLHRFRHLRVLFKLNWFYRVKKGNTPYLFWDVPVSGSINKNETPKIEKEKNLNKSKKSEKKTKFIKQNENEIIYKYRGESFLTNQEEAFFLVKKLLKYDVVIFDLFEIFFNFNYQSKKVIFEIMETINECHNFCNDRIKTEKELSKEYCINDRKIYEALSKKYDINITEEINREKTIFAESISINSRIKELYNMLISMKKDVVFIADTIYDKEFVEKILDRFKITEFKKLYVTSQEGYKKESGSIFKYIKTKELNKQMIYIGDVNLELRKKLNEIEIDVSYVKNVNKAGEKYRVDGMSEIIGSAYCGLVNGHLHTGFKKYNLLYESGFVYGGLFLFGFCKWIEEIKKQLSVNQIIFIQPDNSLCKKIYDEYCEGETINFFWSDYLTIASKKELLINYALDLCKNNKSNNNLSIYDLFCDLGLEDCSFIDVKLFSDKLLVEENMIFVSSLINDNWKEIKLKNDDKLKESIFYLRKHYEKSERIILVSSDISGRDIGVLYSVLERELKTEVIGLCPFLITRNYDEKNGLIQMKKIFTYAFSRMENREHYDISLGSNLKLLSNVIKIFCKDSFGDFKYIKNGKYCWDVFTYDNHYLIEEIQDGIKDFCKLYNDKFCEGTYNLIFNNISGYDAYCPLRTIVVDFDYLLRVFGKYVIKSWNDEKITYEDYILRRIKENN